MTSRMLGVAAILVSAALAGCSSTLPGSVVASTVAIPPGQTDVLRLDHGNFPSTPQPALGAAGTPFLGGLVESQRLAENVILPSQVDPALSVDNPFDTIPLKDASAVPLPDPLPSAAGNYHFVAGFSSARDEAGPVDSPHKALINVVLRFASPQDAASAAADMAGATANLRSVLNPNGPPPKTHPAPIPRYPGTAAVSFDDYPGRVMAITAHGIYVLVQDAGAPGPPEAAAGLVAATLDLQQPLIDQFTPTPVDQLAALPLDPDKLLAKTVPNAAGSDGNVVDGVYGPHGALHFQLDPIAAEAAFTDAKVDHFATRVTDFYATADAAAALRLRDVLAASEATIDYQPAGDVVGMP